jgi:hypothetical protein
MSTKIISAFPGCGKTYFHNNNKNTTLDSDSSHFSWIKDENGNNTKERNPNFPKNYIKHIQDNLGRYDFIFVSSHKEVRDALIDNNLFFYLFFPNKNRKEEFVERYKHRGSPEPFINLISNKWDEWILEIENEESEGKYKKIEMNLANLEEEIKRL